MSFASISASEVRSVWNCQTSNHSRCRALLLFAQKQEGAKGHHRAMDKNGFIVDLMRKKMILSKTISKIIERLGFLFR